MAKRTKKPRKRAPRGTGTVFWSESRKCYVARKTVSGNLVERHGDTQAKAIRRRDEAAPPGPQTTVREWCAKWIEAADVREQTRDLYQQSADLRIIPELGTKRVTAVTAFDVEAAARAWGKEVGANTVRKHLAHLQSCFAAAVRARLISVNPVSGARKPAGTLPEIDPFTPEELRRVVDAASADPELARVAVCVATGCRIGEALGAEQTDFVGDTFAIARTTTRRHGAGPPKSVRSRRVIRVPAHARRAAADIGPAFTYTTLRARWAKLLARLDIRPRGIHQARHAIATHMLAPRLVKGILVPGKPVGDVAKYLGDSPATIIKRYLHASGADICAGIEELLGGDKVAKKRVKRAAPQKKQARGRKAS